METAIKKLEVAPLKNMASFEDKVNRQCVMKNAHGMVFVVALKRGESMPRHLAPEDAMVLCLEGSVVFDTDKGQLTLNAGDFFMMEKHTAHSVSAPQDTKVMLTLINP